MTYENLIGKINSEETGIAKGYDISFLRDVCCYRKNGEKIFDSLVAKDLELFSTIETVLLDRKEPKEGDFVEYADGKFARISVDYRNGAFQLSNNIGVFVSEYGSQASGCVWDPDLDHIERERLVFDSLTPTSKTMQGRCWMFSEGNAGGRRGVYYNIKFKVWLLENLILSCKDDDGNIYEVTANETTFEVCPHCDEEVQLESKFEAQVCSSCNTIILPCSICQVGDNCLNCPLSNHSVEDVYNKYFNKMLEGTGYTACFVETSELYGEDDDEVDEDDPYYSATMYEAHIEDENEDEIDDSWTGRYCDASSVAEELEAYISELLTKR